MCRNNQPKEDDYVRKFNLFSSSFRLGLSFNSISSVENGSLNNVPHLRELHLNNNELLRVPGGLGEHKYIQVKFIIVSQRAIVEDSSWYLCGYSLLKRNIYSICAKLLNRHGKVTYNGKTLIWIFV